MARLKKHAGIKYVENLLNSKVKMYELLYRLKAYEGKLAGLSAINGLL